MFVYKRLTAEIKSLFIIYVFDVYTTSVANGDKHNISYSVIEATHAKLSESTFS